MWTSRELSAYRLFRWAAKEAVIKAVHWRRLSFKHVQILHQRDTPEGSPLYALILDNPASSLATSSVMDTNGSDEEINIRQPNGDGNYPHTDEPALKDVDVHTNTARSSHLKGPFTPAEEQDDDIDGQVAQISISHDGEYATAVCLAAEEPRAGDVGGEAAARGM